MSNAARIAFYFASFGLILFAVVRGETTRSDVADQGDTINRIVRVVEGPCQTRPTSRDCRRIRRALLSAEPKRISCITFRRVGYPCPLDPAVRRAAKRVERSASQTQGGDAQPPPSGTQPPGPPPSGPPNPGPGDNPPPEPPPDRGPVGGLLDDACELTGPLGVCLQ